MNTKTAQHPVLSAILAGGFVAGTIDIGAASAIYQSDPLRIMQAVAGGVLGKASFQDGLSSALLGMSLQWAMSLIIAGIYVFGAMRLPAVSRRWIAGGLGYGVGVFFVMNYLVVPLSAARPDFEFPQFTVAKFSENMVAMLLFGLILAFFVHYFGVGGKSGPGEQR